MNKNAHRNAEDSRSRRAMVGGKLSFSASEAYKLLRTNVMFSLAEDEDGSRIFGITSPIKGEGKSTTAINLAYSIAESAKRVLLIEMDMRLPVLHKSLPISKAPGLSDLLVGSALLTDALQKSGIHDDLYVITAGNLPPNPSELLGSERMKALLESFRERFDYILCDLPPITVPHRSRHGRCLRYHRSQRKTPGRPAADRIPVRKCCIGLGLPAARYCIGRCLSEHS